LVDNGTEFDLPPVVLGSNRNSLVGETKSDSSLETWRKLADSRAEGISWENGLLLKKSRK